MFRWSHVIFVLLLCPAWCVAADRYVAMFADGTRVEEAEVRDWCGPTFDTRVGGRSLFDPQVPVRWILDRTQPPASKPRAYVEFVGGDLLAGEVISYSGGQENPYELQPPHLVVKPTVEAQPPDVVTAAELRVTTEWLRRIVWQPVGGDEYRPKTVWLRSGLSLAFRSLRWTPSGVIILTNDGVKQFSMSELGEIHLPRLNPWTVYDEQLVVLSPQVTSRLIQINGNEGSRWTTSVERFQAHYHGDRNRPEHWYHLIQPAWCLDSIWLRYRMMRAWRFFSPNEVPLSNFLPIASTHQPVFGQGLEWQADQNVQQGPLRSLDHDFGWGFGVHGTSELVFELPSMAQAMRTQYGLDRTAGTGGCVNVELFAGNDRSLMKHMNLVGAHTVGTVDWLEIPIDAVDPAKQRQVTFRTEMAHEGRPVGADPFDVRDFVNWYEPEVRLDQGSLATEVARHQAARAPGLIGWSLSKADSHSIKLANAIDASDARDPQFRLVARSTNGLYTLSRSVVVGPRDRWMTIVAARFAENSSSSTIRVRIDGQEAGEFEVPIRKSMTDPDPILVSVEPFQGRTVAVEVIVSGTDDASWIDWRGFSVSPERPGLMTLFEDDERFAALLNRGMGQVDLDTDKPYSGTNSLRVTPGAGNNAMIPGLEALIREHPRLGQFRHIVFAWRKSTGSRIQLQLANRGRLGADSQIEVVQEVAELHRGMTRTQTADDRGRRFGYCYEEGVATTTTPIPLWMNGNLPRAWQLIQRDLFNDFGAFSVTGLSLNCVDGDAAWFDHLYLARTNQDLEYAAKLLVNSPTTKPEP